MKKIYTYEKGVLKEGKVDDLLHPNKVVWADYLSPSKNELNELSDVSGIPLDDLKEALDEEERPKVMDLEKYSLLIFRAPLFGKDEITTKPISIFLSRQQNDVITLRLSESKSIERINNIIKTDGGNKLFEKGAVVFVYRLIDEILTSFFNVLDDIDEKIDKIESRVFEKPDTATIEQIFQVKKTLIYFHRALTADREVISAIEKEYAFHIQRRDIKQFRTLYNDIVQLIDMESTYRELLTGTLDMYLSSVSNNLNTVMKKLTAMASFVLVPTLITGIYGMNFQFMPELYWKYGYYMSLGLMVFSVVGMYFFFRRKGWI